MPRIDVDCIFKFCQILQINSIEEMFDLCNNDVYEILVGV